MNKKRDIILAMRQKGMTFEEIGNILCVTRQAVHQALNYVDKERFYEQPIMKVKYVGLRNWLMKNRVSLKELGRRCDKTGFSKSLIGDCEPSKSAIDAILGVTGMTYEECFTSDGG